MKKYKVIAIAGKAGSGKDAIMRGVLNAHPSFNEIISCTTRPIRDNEEEGVNYYYLTVEDFIEKALSGKMLEYTKFNGWYYGTGINTLKEDKVNIGVFNPAGIKALVEDERVEPIIFYVRAADKTRLLRQLNRETDPNVEEIIRRYSADNKDFDGFEQTYRTLFLENNTWTDFDKCVNKILDVVSTVNFE